MVVPGGLNECDDIELDFIDSTCKHINTYSYVNAMQAKPRKGSRPNSEEEVDQLADMFRLMGDATRLRIILVCLNEPISVGAIAGRLDLSPSLVSHHLRLLKAARLLGAERRGKQVFYSALDEHIRCVITDMVTHVGEPLDVDGAE
jgi:DNA-binding transcriptional ArsR family regulator